MKKPFTAVFQWDTYSGKIPVGGGVIRQPIKVFRKEWQAAVNQTFIILEFIKRIFDFPKNLKFDGMLTETKNIPSMDLEIR